MEAHDPSEDCTLALANFARDDLAFGAAATSRTDLAGGRLGFSVSSEQLDQRTVKLRPIPPDASLAEHGAELLDLGPALRAAGLGEGQLQLDDKAHRLRLGQLVQKAVAARFGRSVVHMADTSRVSGAAGYGEVTVRDTAPGSGLRAGHHAVHVDQYLPGIARVSGRRDGAQAFVESWWPHWAPDFARFGVDQQSVVRCVTAAQPGLINLWVSLTPGEITQSPLVVADRRTLALQQGSLDQGSLDQVCTVPVQFPGLDVTLTLLRSKVVADDVRWLWRPRMKFGEALLFSTMASPHSAVQLIEPVDEKPRQSAEMRLFVLDQLHNNVITPRL